MFVGVLSGWLCATSDIVWLSVPPMACCTYCRFEPVFCKIMEYHVFCANAVPIVCSSN